MKQLLDNIMWHTLTGPHARHATGTAAARRYAAGFSPLLAFADPLDPDFTGLDTHCKAKDHLICDGWSGPVPAGWRIAAETTMFKMVWEGAAPAADEADDAVQLGPQHATQALELARLTRPGPFGPRTIELGDYFGCFEGAELVAMAGERLAAGSWREVSGVCTKPGFQGRGLARRLVLKLVGRQLQRGELPFLHVVRDNLAARGLYERMGFANHLESVVRVVTPC